MTVKQLNLESIPEEVIDECFVNENEMFENIIQVDDEVLEDVEESTFDVLDSKLKLPENLTNEILIDRIKAGIDVKKNTTMIVKYNSGLVYGQARLCTCNIPFQDKVQYGFEGLLRAIDKYDSTHKIQFSTYATVSIRQTMYNYGNDDVRLVALPRYLSVANIQMQSFMSKYRSKYGRTPSPEEISEGTNIELPRVKRLIQYANTSPMSIDTPISNGDSTDMSLGDIIKGESKEFTLNEKAVQSRPEDVIALVMSELPPEEQLLLNHIHGLNGHTEKTLDKLVDLGLVDTKGKVMKARSTIHRKYTAVLEKIRIMLKERGVSADD